MNFRHKISACAYAYTGSVTASKAATKKWSGVIRIFRIGKNWILNLMAEIKEAKQCISVLKYSPDGLTLAAGSKDNSVYLYSVPQQYKVFKNARIYVVALSFIRA